MIKKKVVRMGIKMLEIIEDVRKKCFDGLGMRIGVHTVSNLMFLLFLKRKKFFFFSFSFFIYLTSYYCSLL